MLNSYWATTICASFPRSIGVRRACQVSRGTSRPRRGNTFYAKRGDRYSLWKDTYLLYVFVYVDFKCCLSSCRECDEYSVSVSHGKRSFFSLKAVKGICHWPEGRPELPSILEFQNRGHMILFPIKMICLIGLHDVRIVERTWVQAITCQVKAIRVEFTDPVFVRSLPAGVSSIFDYSCEHWMKNIHDSL